MLTDYNHTTIQEALNETSAGDTVVVRGQSGPYAVNLTVNTRVVLIGQGTSCGTTYPTELAGSVTFNPSASGSIMSGIFVNSAGNGVFLNANTTNIVLKRCRFRTQGLGGGKAVNGGNGTSVTLEECLVETSNTTNPIRFAQTNMSLTARNCVFSVFAGNGTTAVMADINGRIVSLFLINCVFLDYSVPLVGSTGSSWHVDNCVFWNTSWNGTMNYTNFVGQNNAITTTMESFPGANSIVMTADPFVAYTPRFDPCVDDIHLAETSVLIDAGDSTSAPDRDGSRRDLGVYGGPFSYDPFGSPDFPFVTELIITPDVPQNGVLEFHTTGRVGRGQ